VFLIDFKMIDSAAMWTLVWVKDWLLAARLVNVRGSVKGYRRWGVISKGKMSLVAEWASPNLRAG
jgi:hypothetical protein